MFEAHQRFIFEELGAQVNCSRPNHYLKRIKSPDKSPPTVNLFECWRSPILVRCINRSSGQCTRLGRLLR